MATHHAVLHLEPGRVVVHHVRRQRRRHGNVDLRSGRRRRRDLHDRRHRHRQGRQRHRGVQPRGRSSRSRTSTPASTPAGRRCRRSTPAPTGSRTTTRRRRSSSPMAVRTATAAARPWSRTRRCPPTCPAPSSTPNAGAAVVSATTCPSPTGTQVFVRLFLGNNFGGTERGRSARVRHQHRRSARRGRSRPDRRVRQPAGRDARIPHHVRRHRRHRLHECRRESARQCHRGRRSGLVTRRRWVSRPTASTSASR